MPCPTPERLQQLLDETLPAADAQIVTRHVEGCAHCQQCLEKITSGAGTWNVTWERIARHLGADEAPGTTEAEGDTPAGGDPTQALHSAVGDDEVDLSFLSPPRKAGSLGALDKYDILAVQGRGGFGVVFKAFDASLHRVVAIKVLNPALASVGTARHRFVREARTAAAVSHENVVAIHEVNEAAPIPYLAMQFVSGQTLHDKLNKAGPLGVKEILRIGMQTAEGLAAAHKQGLVHRDIKPANILLENGVERVKITDFGLARAVDDASISQSGVIAGTPMYMSPEQAHGQPVDHRSDLFSLGSVLYTLCTGRPPFRAESTMAVLKRVCEEDPRPIREVNSDIPDWLAAIVAKLMAKNAADRFQTASEVADLLGRHLAHLQEPSSAPLPAPVPVPVGEASAAAARAALAKEIEPKVKGWMLGYIAVMLLGGVSIAARLFDLLFSQTLLVAAGLTAATALVSFAVAWLGSGQRRPIARSLAWVMTVAALSCGGLGSYELLEPRHATLHVESRDPSMTLTLEDAGGNVLRNRFASAQLRLPPGAYTLLGHQGRKEVHREMFFLQAGDHAMRGVALPLAARAAAGPGWAPLFNGRDLAGWKQVAGWKVVDGVLDGVLVGQGTDQFLLSERGDFADFTLRVEAKINAAGNSGVFFRCPPTAAGGGYEAEIATHGDLGQTGSLYAYPPRRILSRETRVLSQPDQWFVMEIEAVKGRLTVKVDGKVASDVADASHKSGSLALQCFTKNTVVQFRRIDIKEIRTAKMAAEEEELNRLVEIETREVDRLQKMLKAETIPVHDLRAGEVKLLEAKIRLAETLRQPAEAAKLGRQLVLKHEQIVEFVKKRHEQGLVPQAELDRALRQLLDARQLWPDEPAPAERTGVLQQLHQIGLAMHNYLDKHQAFPAQASYDKDGKALLSWRVHLLPFLDQENLHRQFKRDEPWDSAHNKTLIGKMPDVYRSARSKRDPADGKTTFLVPVGEKLMFLGARQTKFAALVFGSSNTILAVDADNSEAVAWTKPQDLAVDRRNPSLGLARQGDPPQTPMLFADGHVRMLRANLTAEEWWGYFQAFDAAPK